MFRIFLMKDLITSNGSVQIEGKSYQRSLRNTPCGYSDEKEIDGEGKFWAGLIDTHVQLAWNFITGKTPLFRMQNYLAATLPLVQAKSNFVEGVYKY